MSDEFPLDPPEEKVNKETGEITQAAPVAQVPQIPQDRKHNAITKKEEEKMPATPFQKLLQSKKKALENFLGDEHNALRFMSAVMYCMEKIPELATCNHNSLMGAFMECAALGLYPGTNSGDCYVLPYGGQAQFQMGYRGFKTLAYRAGILACGSDIVRENDKYREFRGTNPRVEHTVPLKGERGEAYRAYAWAEVTPGNIVFKSMNKEEIMKIKELSKSKNSKYSPWNSANDPELWMWQKTCFKQLAKLLPTSEKMDRAVYVDNVSERGGYFSGESEIIEPEFSDDSEIKILSGKDKKQALRERKQ